MANQSSLGAVTQIRKGVTTPREPAIAPWSNPFVPRSFSISLLFFSLYFFFFLSFFFFVFDCKWRPLFECRLSLSLSLALSLSLSRSVRVYARGQWKPGRCPCEAVYQPRPVNEARATFSLPSFAVLFTCDMCV